MTFLVDAQLPPELARWLSTGGHQARHVTDATLLRGDDRAIWEHARQNDAIIVSKDEDFVDRWLMDQNPVGLIWIRKGNCSNRALLEWLAPLWLETLKRLELGERLIKLRE